MVNNMLDERYTQHLCQRCKDLLPCRYKVTVFDKQDDSTHEYWLCSDCATELELRLDFDINAYVYLDE